MPEGCSVYPIRLFNIMPRMLPSGIIELLFHNGVVNLLIISLATSKLAACDDILAATNDSKIVEILNKYLPDAVIIPLYIPKPIIAATEKPAMPPKIVVNIWCGGVVNSIPYEKSAISVPSLKIVAAIIRDKDISDESPVETSDEVVLILLITFLVWDLIHIMVHIISNTAISSTVALIISCPYPSKIFVIYFVDIAAIIAPNIPMAIPV